MTILRNPFKGKFIAFHKRELLSEYILEYIICKALCGLITPTGAKLVLVPDTRHGSTDVSGLQTIGKKLPKTDNFSGVRIGRSLRSDCLTLKQQITLYRKSSQMPKLAKNRSKNINNNNALKTPKTQSGTTPLDPGFLHNSGDL